MRKQACQMCLYMSVCFYVRQSLTMYISLLYIKYMKIPSVLN